MPRRSRRALGLWLLLLSGLQGSAQPMPPQGYVGTYVWLQPGDDFGGFSGIEILDGGAGFVALSDKAAIVAGRIARDTDGRIARLTAGPLIRLRAAETGAPLTDRLADSEGLAIGADGAVFVSFENRARVARLDMATGRTQDLPVHSDFAGLPRNGALEALAIDAQGTLYTLPEESAGTTFPVYRSANGGWDSAMSIPKSGRFLPVAADFGPDGRFYLLERDFRGIGGFASQLRRFDLTETGLVGETTLLTTEFGLHDNLEGLSIWHDATGALRATMIADDNFFALQRTELVEYRLPD